MNKGFCDDAKIQKDGNVYFTLEVKGTNSRFMECVVEWDEEYAKFVFRANDHELIVF